MPLPKLPKILSFTVTAEHPTTVQVQFTRELSDEEWEHLTSNLEALVHGGYVRLETKDV